MKQASLALRAKKRFFPAELMGDRRPDRPRKTRRPLTADWDPEELEAAESWGLKDFSDLLPKGSF
ncbi:MAG: hypothetical protein H6970_04660 [Gammaproteobacteria bacterium]|nr:hypothetical protein [Gammaproteobacteria bacterium]MCP5424340.1 hypothetical protein [Gammaproteobacteria bacterium]MCP5459094.1 hypothetical protein [Gammaproteobacteria bacterium]